MRGRWRSRRIDHGERRRVTMEWGEWRARDGILRGECSASMFAGLFGQTVLEFRGIGAGEDHGMAVLDGRRRSSATEEFVDGNNFQGEFVRSRDDRKVSHEGTMCGKDGHRVSRLGHELGDIVLLPLHRCDLEKVKTIKGLLFLVLSTKDDQELLVQRSDSTMASSCSGKISSRLWYLPLPVDGIEDEKIREELFVTQSTKEKDATLDHGGGMLLASECELRIKSLELGLCVFLAHPRVLFDVVAVNETDGIASTVCASSKHQEAINLARSRGGRNSHGGVVAATGDLGFVKVHLR